MMYVNWTSRARRSQTTMGNFIYVTDVHNNAIDMYDHSFKLVHTPGAFVDTTFQVVTRRSISRT